MLYNHYSSRVYGVHPRRIWAIIVTTTMRFLALGDSYTIGEAVDPTERWTVQLVRLLHNQNILMDAPIIIAKTGWTTDELAQAIDAANLADTYDLVSLLVGVNNQYRGLAVEDYRREFTALLERAIRFAGGRPSRVLVLSIPDWGVTPFATGRDRAAIARDVDRFNAVNREATTRLGARYLDVTPASRQTGSDPAWLASDGLHPSGKMYAGWARLALPVACEALARD
jgi:lysophospholipase L1-like esterase